VLDRIRMTGAAALLLGVLTAVAVPLAATATAAPATTANTAVSAAGSHLAAPGICRYGCL